MILLSRLISYIMSRQGIANKTKIIRTFHPVGQGAFYTEKHIKGDKCSNIVYDCGSNSKDVDWDRVIRDAFKEGEVIDLLFISHFHADHINGLDMLLSHCKTIKKVVIPLIEDEDKALFKLFNLEATGGEKDYGALIDDPQEFFGKETQILKVVSIDGENEKQNVSTDFITSGTKIEVESIRVNWCFIPFNYDYGARMTSFRKLLIEKGLAADQLKTIEGVLENRDTILEAYKELTTDINEDSLVLFSGKLVNPPYDDSIFIELLNMKGYYLYQFDMGCLYLGDANLNKDEFLSELENRLKDYYHAINTIQIPHHGSESSFSIDILKRHPQNIISVITCGATRKKHPSGEVLKQIAVSGSTLFVVTEEMTSKLVQEGEY